MKRNFLILVLLCLYGCMGKRPNVNNITSSDLMIDYEKLFILENLNDTLNKYISYIDSVEVGNPYYNPNIYMIYISEGEVDYIIEFFAIGVTPIEFMDKNMKSLDHFKRGGYINKNYIVVFSESNNLNDIIYNDLISHEFSNKIDSMFSPDIYADWDFIYPLWKYRLINNNLILLEKKQGSMGYR